ncbi:MAG: hypothetical protein PWP19_1763 [Thermococcaceae archaeon]|nr:hypothetical protein [Thermococcaceae archaeon]
MIRILFSLVVFLHGLIHLLGFVKEWNLAEVKQLTGNTLIPLSGGLSKIAGILWLAAGLLFIASAATYLLRKEWWWMLAGIAIPLSQILIIIYWKDAKFGTIATVIVLIACILSYGTWSFDRMTSDELDSFLPEKIERRVVTAEMIDEQPAVVQKWLKRSNIIGKDIMQSAYLKQRGEMRLKPDSDWMKFEAEQYITTNPPGFMWVADVKSTFMHFSGRDKYEDGRGHMLIKLFSLIPVVDAKGKEIDQGVLLRYLGEIVLVPSASLSDYISWEEIDSTTAKATMSYGGITASGTFKFDENGDFVSFEADRYLYSEEGSTLKRWVISANEYGEFGGIRIPVNLSVTWKLDEDFTWYKVEIVDIEYNRAVS